MVTKAEALRRKRANRPQPKTAPAEPRVIVKTPPIVRDGWEWLKVKNRVNDDQRRAGDYYRKLYRDPGDAPAIRSCLDIQEGGGSAKANATAMSMAWNVSADQELAMIREEHLTGDDELINLMDAVCGRGVTLRDLARGNERKARDLEVTLRIALKLAFRYLEPERRAA